MGTMKTPYCGLTVRIENGKGSVIHSDLPRTKENTALENMVAAHAALGVDVNCPNYHRAIDLITDILSARGI